MKYDKLTKFKKEDLEILANSHQIHLKRRYVRLMKGLALKPKGLLQVL